MDSQDTATEYLFKIWPTIEANKNRILGGVGAVVVVVLLSFAYSWQKDQKEISAGEAYSKLLISLQPTEDTAQLADQYLKVASDYSGTAAGQRALLQGAADLFAAGKYADAQTQFQKFADSYAGSSMMSTADLGIAASEEALGKTDDALDAYKKITEDFSDLPSQISAKFAIGRIYEQKGRPMDAIKYYEEVTRSAAGTTMGQQASLKAVELKMALPAPKAPVMAPAAAAPPAMSLTPPSK